MASSAGPFASSQAGHETASRDREFAVIFALSPGLEHLRHGGEPDMKLSEIDLAIVSPNQRRCRRLADQMCREGAGELILVGMVLMGSV